VLVGGCSTFSIEVIKYFRMWKEHCSLEVEVPRLFSVAGVFPGVRDGYYLLNFAARRCLRDQWMHVRRSETVALLYLWSDKLKTELTQSGNYMHLLHCPPADDDLQTFCHVQPLNTSNIIKQSMLSSLGIVHGVSRCTCPLPCYVINSGQIP
jgi:hypothetical protein